ncbi:uncharacterized protein LOC123905837 isoform X2 [Trifolium pratense]|uniref:uncharacterized protein LOC123905837 isoform X2 n=1 Tax=Trifolium pratense TaxID=57577 RepID=UPI001E692D48|nr:uncharacterized protein LOC123905837 isoform X2 [Trifolium pratense]
MTCDCLFLQQKIRERRIFISNFPLIKNYQRIKVKEEKMSCRQLFGCTAKSNSLSYGSSSALSHDSGCATTSFFSPWICRKDCNISEVSWLSSSHPVLHRLHAILVWLILILFF